MKSKKLQKVLIALGILLILFLGYHLYLEYQSDIHLLIDPKANEQQLLHSVRSHGLSAAVILILLMGIMCAIPGVPTAVIGVIVGLSYGPFLGALINIVGNASGNILAISLMQHLKLVDHSKKSNRWVKAIHSMKHPKIGIMVGYMVPIIPSSVINFATTTLNLQVREILMSIIIGVIPSSVLYACGGEALFHGYSKTALLLIASVLILTLLIVVIYKDHRKKQVE